MKAVNILTAILVIVGALNWGLVGAFKFNLVTAIFGDNALSSIVFIVVAIAGIYQLVRIFAAPKHDALAVA